MSMLTDVDFREAVDRDIVIEPFDPRCLSTIGYDCRVGDFVFSLEHGLLHPRDGAYAIPGGDTVQILTREAIWVSSRIAGTIHSRVALVSRGFGHVSTTLDPGWYGPLLVTVQNHARKVLELQVDQMFVTVLFYRVRTPTSTVHKRFGFVQRLLVQQSVTFATDEYVAKIAKLLGGNEVTEAFRSRVEAANARALNRVLGAMRRLEWTALRRRSLVVALWAGIVALSTVSLYWQRIRSLFGGVEYDSAILVGQVTCVIALLAVLLTLREPS